MSEFLTRRSGLVIVAVLLFTVALIPPMLLLATDEIASTEPGGEVFELRDEIDAKLTAPLFTTVFVAEARDGDMLTQEALWELYQRQQGVREADREGELSPPSMGDRSVLAESFDSNTGATYTGISTLADAVQQMLALHPALGTTLEEATDDQVKFAVAQLLMSPLTASLSDQLSAQATSERREVLGREIDYWRSPALIFIVSADNEALGGGRATAGIATDETGLDKERYARNVQSVLRGGEEQYQLWGLAIDQTLEAQEQGMTAGVFIMLTVVSALAIVGLSLRSYWAAALTAGGIGALMIWLKGISVLVGIKGGLIVDLIVPIAMVSLGVDFAVHAARRYKEERGHGYPPQRAVAIGMAGVLGALFLAMLSDSIAFLSTVPSGIEAIVHFGIAAGIAVASSFVVLGVALPLAMMRVDTLALARGFAPGRHNRWLVMAAGAGVTLSTGAGVIILVALDQALGVAILVASTAIFVGLPLAMLVWGGRRFAAAEPESSIPSQTVARAEAASQAPDDPRGDQAPSRMERSMAGFVTALARRRVIVLPVAVVATAIAGLLAFQLEATFDVEDFFSPDSDLVVGLDKLDQHVADRGGEVGIVFLQGDLSQPDLLAAIQEFIDDLAGNPYVGNDADGTASVFSSHVATMVGQATASESMRERILAETGVEVADADGDGLPDTAGQARAVLRYLSEHGLADEEGALVYSPEEVASVFFWDAQDPSQSVATLQVGIPGTREQSVIPLAREAIDADLAQLRAHPAVERAGLTGSPFIRDAELSAAVDSLRVSIPLAAAGAFVLLLVALRSLRYAVVTVIPIGLVVVWLYAVMEVAGFSLNFVTATIGAVSIGVGIDYSIHMTVRFREEMARSASRLAALEHAARGTGVALLASAGSSVVGFAIMGLAPMPLFSTYGILTAVMIFLALAASLVVLPSLLMLSTGGPAAAETQLSEAGGKAAHGV